MIGALRSSSTEAGVPRISVRGLLAGIPHYLRLLLRLIGDSRVSTADKALLAGAVVYALAPLDLIPDFIPLVGQLDDLFLLALAIDRLVANAGPELLRAHWEGPEELLTMLRGSLGELARRLPAAVRRQLRREAGAR
jgi:uncharacterized membrane protein YkvA (DUF1232 family)